MPELTEQYNIAERISDYAHNIENNALKRKTLTSTTHQQHHGTSKLNLLHLLDLIHKHDLFSLSLYCVRHLVHLDLDVRTNYTSSPMPIIFAITSTLNCLFCLQIDTRNRTICIDILYVQILYNFYFILFV